MIHPSKMKSFYIYKVEKKQNILFSTYSKWTNTVIEYHCKDLGDSYYDVNYYQIYYFAEDSYPYSYKTPEEIVEIVKQGNNTPTYIEKGITTKILSYTFTECITQKEVVLYIPEKIRHETYYYGIAKKK